MLSVSPSHLVYRQGDLLPAVQLRVVRGLCGCPLDAEQPIDPALYSGWTLTLVGLATVTVALTYDPSTQLLAGSFGAGDTDVPGRYLGYVSATETASGKPRTFPTDHDLD